MSTTTQTNPAAAADTVEIEIDGKPVKAKKGQMLIQAADAIGAYIPRFCYHDKLSIAANCRMCLVEVEKAPKPLPACATPVMPGMKVHTRSDYAREAQRGTIEFLLINHPLDCPVCDQGGECPLQDQTVGYGGDVSRYYEGKRVVEDKDIGPLIETEMTRCIHCTRCVRFGQEIAGNMELGAPGRGEHMQITTFLEQGVDSELSGNMIDICPVGALTSKPYRFTARAWELASNPSVSPHDCVGTNVNVQTLRGRVKRVLPRRNEAINEEWITDRDRFSYTGLNVEDRLTQPMIKQDGRWLETDWDTALNFAAAGIKEAIAKYGAEQFGALAAPISTYEEFYLLQKMVRALGSPHIDHRLHQEDFSDDVQTPLYPWLGQSIADLEHTECALLIGSNLRKDQPLLAHRLREAQKRGAKIAAINAIDFDFAFPLKEKIITEPTAMWRELAGVAHALAELTQTKIDKSLSWINQIEPSKSAQRIASLLHKNQLATILLGNLAQSHSQAAVLRALARQIADMSRARLGQLVPANGAAAWLAGCIPHRDALGKKSTNTGLNARTMLEQPRKAYLLLNVEPEYDCLMSSAAHKAIQQAQFTVMLTGYKPSADSDAANAAHVLLPASPFTENEGTFINTEGRAQSFATTVKPISETRPAWKILTNLAQKLELPDFNYKQIKEVVAAAPVDGTAPNWPEQRTAIAAPETVKLDNGQLYRIAETPMYAIDAIVRHAVPLQKTHDNPTPAARLNEKMAAALSLKEGERVFVQMEGAKIDLDVIIDPRIADNCVYIPHGYSETAALSGHGPVIISGTIGGVAL